jgi:hypothetical protein
MRPNPFVLCFGAAFLHELGKIDAPEIHCVPSGKQAKIAARR